MLNIVRAGSCNDCGAEYLPDHKCSSVIFKTSINADGIWEYTCKYCGGSLPTSKSDMGYRYPTCEHIAPGVISYWTATGTYWKWDGSIWVIGMIKEKVKW